MKRTDVQVIERTTLFRGYNRIDHYTLKYRLFDGLWSKKIGREVFERGHGVLVVLFDPELDKIVLVEQFRHGAFAALSSPWFDAEASPWTLECVAGNLLDNEVPEEVAARESKEEAGCYIKDLIAVGHYLLSPSCSSQSVFIFCACIDASKVGGIHGLAEEGEHTRALAMPASEVFEWLDSGKIVTAGAVIALQWFKLNYGDLRKRWLA